MIVNFQHQPCCLRWLVARLNNTLLWLVWLVKSRVSSVLVCLFELILNRLTGSKQKLLIWIRCVGFWENSIHLNKSLLSIYDIDCNTRVSWNCFDEIMHGKLSWILFVEKPDIQVLMIIGVEVGKYYNKEFGKINNSRAAATIIVMAIHELQFQMS